MLTAAHANFIPTACGTPGHEPGAIFIDAVAKRCPVKYAPWAAANARRVRGISCARLIVHTRRDPAPIAYISPPDPILFLLASIARAPLRAHLGFKFENLLVAAYRTDAFAANRRRRGRPPRVLLSKT